MLLFGMRPPVSLLGSVRPYGRPHVRPLQRRKTGENGDDQQCGHYRTHLSSHPGFFLVERFVRLPSLVYLFAFTLPGFEIALPQVTQYFDVEILEKTAGKICFV